QQQRSQHVQILEAKIAVRAAEITRSLRQHSQMRCRGRQRYAEQPVIGEKMRRGLAETRLEANFVRAWQPQLSAEKRMVRRIFRGTHERAVIPITGTLEGISWQSHRAGFSAVLQSAPVQRRAAHIKMRDCFQQRCPVVLTATQSRNRFENSLAGV